ncbi:MAG TPA: tetratricopeptide repeat protein, partial [Caldimonas sp.]
DDPALLDRSSLLATVLDLHLAETPTTRDMSGRGRLDATAELLIHLLHATDSGSTRVVILEDVHWLDSPSWSVVEQAAHQVRGLCLLLTARPRVDNPLPARAVVLLDAATTTRVVLAPLGDAAVRDVIAAQLGVSVVPDAIVRLVSDKTQGMPLFVRQVLGTLIDSRTVRIDAGAVRYDLQALAGFSIPDTIRGAVISRIDRLSPRQQFTLKKASVVGRVFTLEALGSADAGDASAEELRADIEAIAARGLVEPGPAPGEFSFSHALIRDAVYSLLPFERRRQLHAALAAWYERRVGDDPEMLGRIGNHYAEAHDPVRAPRALESAGDRALRTGAYREAQSLFRRLVEISATGFGAGSDARVSATDEDLAGWRLRLGLSSYDLGELESARIDLEIAAKLLRDPIPTERAIGLRLGVEIVKALARGLLRRGARPRQEHTRERQLARVLSALGWIYSLIQRPNHMLFTIVRRFNLLADGAPSAEQMGAFSGTMYLLMMLGRHRLGDAFAARIVEIQRGLQQPRAYADAIYVVALAYVAQARWEECERHATEAEQIFARLGERRLRMVVIALLANAAELRGAFERASEFYSALLQMAEESGDPLSKCWATGGLAMIAIRQGRFDDGRAMAETAVALARSIGETAADLTSSGSLAICALETGDVERARALVAEGVELLAKMPRLATAQHVLNGLDTFSEAILLLWERDAPVRGSADWKQRAGHAALATSRMNGYARVFAIGAPAAANRRALEHWLHNRREKAIAMWKHAIAEGERSRIPYETGKAHLELARHLPLGNNERRVHAEAAAAIFERIGAPAGLTRARAAGHLQPASPQRS